MSSTRSDPRVTVRRSGSADTMAAMFLRATFALDDRLAIVLLHRPTGRTIQRLGPVRRLTSPQWQAWLRAMNAQAHDVFYSINAVSPTARGRTKQDVAVVRHLFLDFDTDAEHAVACLRGARDMPALHHLVRSSPGHYQVLWRVADITQAAAEHLQQRLAQQYGADRAATDVARVARWPGFRNYKYPARPLVTSCSAADLRPYGRDRFPALELVTPALTLESRPRRARAAGHSQSERDWQWAVRQLATGHAFAQIEQLLALQRRDKHQPEDYAARTTDAAWAALALRAGRSPDDVAAELAARRYTRANAAAYAASVVGRAVTRAQTRTGATP